MKYKISCVKLKFADYGVIWLDNFFLRGSICKNIDQSANI